MFISHISKRENLTTSVLVLSLIIATIIMKWIMIHYGLPHYTHVDESTVLKNSFKIALMYAEGNFEQSNNLYNWLMLLFFAVVFAFGILSGRWHSLSEFKMFLISDSPDFLLYGRMLSMIFSVAATLILIKLIYKITPDKWLRILFSAMIVFNPIELNTVNWAKFDALAYLGYAVVLYYAYEYFVLKNSSIRNTFYIVLFAALSIRIELVCYLAGFLVYEFFTTPKTERVALLKSMLLPVGIGLLLYSVITLYPIKFIYTLFFYDNDAYSLVTSQTFEKAILADLSISSIVYGLRNVDFYLYCLLALVSPIVVVAFFYGYWKKIYRFLFIPFAIMFTMVAIYPVKNTHYLLNVSVLILMVLFGVIVSIKNTKISYTLGGIVVLWMASFTINQVSMLAGGDVRIKAADYILTNSMPTDTLYIDGIFSQIKDKPLRYKIKADAAQQTGSTGLSNEYYASTLSDHDTRVMTTVSSFEPFANTQYERVFNNYYDTAMLMKDKPDYYINVSSQYNRIGIEQNVAYPYYQAFYKKVEENYTLDREFKYTSLDSRLYFANPYYFCNVAIYRPR